jgi:TolB-like protein
MMRRSLTYYAMPLFALTIVGCGGKTNEAQTAPQIEQYRIVRIAVLPFRVERPTLGQERGYAAPTPPVEAAEHLTDIFYRKLKNWEGINVIPSYETQDERAMVAGPLTRAVITSIGKKLGADAILEGTVEVYKERTGSAMGLDRPQDAAEVGFAAQLISVKDGVALWTGQYHERQRPATEDLTGLLERGPRYLTVEQLASSAVDHVLRKFPLGQPPQKSPGSTPAVP